MLKVFRNVKAVVAATLLSITANAANASVIEYSVGAGDSTAHVLVNFVQGGEPGAEYLFKVKFNTVTTGLGLLDIIELASATDTDIPVFDSVRTFFPAGQFPADVFIKELSFDDSSNTNEPWPGNYWSYYNRSEANVAWDYASTGAGGRFIEDGGWDAWTFTGGSPSGVPVPEPASALMIAAGVVMIFARRQK